MATFAWEKPRCSNLTTEIQQNTEGTGDGGEDYDRLTAAPAQTDKPGWDSWGEGASLEKHAAVRSTYLKNVVLHVTDLNGFAAVAILL